MTTTTQQPGLLRYSQELAAYTYKQYDAARQSLEHKGRSEAPSPTSQTNGVTPGSSTSLITFAGAHDERLGVQAVDYAHRSQRR
jgi:hypothetical protein